jgi:hypothetical protein
MPKEATVMKSLKTCCVLIAGCWALPALACDNPKMVAIPEGDGVTMDQLLAAQATVKTYMSAMNEYLACLDNEMDAQGDDAPAQFKSLMVTRHNAAVTEMESIAAAFNKQVQAYKAAHADEGDSNK